MASCLVNLVLDSSFILDLLCGYSTFGETLSLLFSSLALVPKKSTYFERLPFLYLFSECYLEPVKSVFIMTTLCVFECSIMFICISPLWLKLLHTKHFFCDNSIFLRVVNTVEVYFSLALLCRWLHSGLSLLPCSHSRHSGWENFLSFITWLCSLLLLHPTERSGPFMCLIRKICIIFSPIPLAEPHMAVPNSKGD